MTVGTPQNIPQWIGNTDFWLLNLSLNVCACIHPTASKILVAGSMLLMIHKNPLICTSNIQIQLLVLNFTGSKNW